MDDDALSARRFAEQMEACGFDVTLASDGLAGLRCALASVYDAVIAQLRMPGLDGVALVERLRPIQTRTVFALMTAMPELDLHRRPEPELLDVDMMAKPWDTRELADSLWRALQLRGMRRPAPTPEAMRCLVLGTGDDAQTVCDLLSVAGRNVVLRVRTLDEALQAVEARLYDVLFVAGYATQGLGIEAAATLGAASIEAPIIIIGDAPDLALVSAPRTSGACYLPTALLSTFWLDRAIIEACERRSTQLRLRYSAGSGTRAALGATVTFGEQLAHAVAQAGLDEQPMGLMLVALDGLDVVARTFGSEGTAAVMAASEKTIQAVVGDQGRVARLGFGEFGLLLMATRDRGALVAIAKQLELRLREPIQFDTEAVMALPRIGVTVYPESGRAADSLLQGARSALLRAGAREQGRFELFLPNVTPGRRLGHDRIIESLRAARIHEELVLHYQPQVNLQTSETVALEALLRWRFSDDQLLAPDGFLSMLTDASTAVDVGAWVLRAACAEARQWQAQAGRPLRVAVNLSGAQYGDARLPMLVSEALASSGLSPELLELEVSEQTLMASAADTERVLRSLKAIGVRIAIDDFGTGYASLGVLRRFAIDTIKIDQSFVRAIERGGQGGTVARGIIELGHKLDLQVVAVGVETRNQLNFLTREGCDIIQGYLTGAPVEVWLPEPAQL